MTLFTLDEFADAAEVVARHVHSDAAVRLATARCRGRRGGLVEARELHADRRVQGARRVGRTSTGSSASGRTVRGIVSATRGNHGQSLAFAGRAAGVPVTIVVPHGNSPDKNAAMRALRSRADRARRRLPGCARALGGAGRGARPRGGAVVPPRSVHGRGHVRARALRRGRSSSMSSTCRWEWVRASSAS